MARSEQAVTWLMGGKLRMPAEIDRNEQFARCCETFDRLLNCATGKIGTPSLAIKAPLDVALKVRTHEALADFYRAI